MPIVKIALDQNTYETLIAMASRERRLTQWQAEVLLRRALLQESSTYEPDPEAKPTDSVENDASNRNGPAVCKTARP